MSDAIQTLILIEDKVALVYDNELVAENDSVLFSIEIENWTNICSIDGGFATIHSNENTLCIYKDFIQCVKREENIKMYNIYEACPSILVIEVEEGLYVYDVLEDTLERIYGSSHSCYIGYNRLAVIKRYREQNNMSMDIISMDGEVLKRLAIPLELVSPRTFIYTHSCKLFISDSFGTDTTVSITNHRKSEVVYKMSRVGDGKVPVRYDYDKRKINGHRNTIVELSDGRILLYNNIYHHDTTISIISMDLKEIIEIEFRANHIVSLPNATIAYLGDNKVCYRKIYPSIPLIAGRCHDVSFHW